MNTMAKKTTCVLAAAAIAFAVAFAGVAINVSQADAATPKVVTYSKAYNAKSFKKAAAGKACGKKSGKALVEVKMTIAKGSTIQYSVLNNKGKWKTAKNGKVAKAGTGMQALKVKLAGKAAKSYDVWYQVYVKGYGWMGWAKNNAQAGNKGNKMYVTSFKVKLVAKGKSLNTDRAAFSKKNGFITKITGVTKTDNAIKKVASKQGMDLMKCIVWANDGISYAATGRDEITATSQFTTARLKTEANAAFVKKAGDCYTHTAAGYCLAKYLGYTAKSVVGTYTSASGNEQVYSWITVTLGGEKHICDTLNGTAVAGNVRCDIAPADELYAQFKAVK